MMNLFLARVELQRVGTATRDLYADLHAYMARVGYVRTITGTQGTSQLPTGTYVLSADITASRALELAKGAAELTGHRYEIFCCKFDDWASQNLPTA